MMQTNHMIEHSDVPKSSTIKIEAEEIEVPQRIVNCKKKICDIIHFCLLVMNEHKVEEFLMEYKLAVELLDKNSGIDTSLLGEHDQLFDIFDVKSEDQEQKDKKRTELIKTFFGKMDQIIDKLWKKATRLELEKNFSLFKTIADLIQIKDHGLKTSTVKLMGTLYNQTKTMGETIFKLQILDHSKSKQHFEQAKQFSITLDKIGDTIEKWYSQGDTSEVSALVPILNKIQDNLLNNKNKDGQIKDFLGREDNSKFPDMNMLDFKKTTSENALSMQNVIAKNKINAGSLDLRVYPGVCDTHEYLIRSFEESIETFEQNLQRNTGILRSLIIMLEFDAETQSERERPELNSLLLIKIYRILAKACRSNDANKDVLTEKMDSVILRHFQQETDLNSAFLIKELITDNKAILLNEQKVKKISQSLCAMADEMKNDGVNKGYILSMMWELLKYRDFVLTKNQNLVLSMIISKQFKNIRIHFESQDLENDLVMKARNKLLSKNIKTIDSNKVLVLPTEVCYVVAYLTLLSGCAESKNAFSENICQNLISLE